MKKSLLAVLLAVAGSCSIRPAYAQQTHSVTLSWAPNATGDPVQNYNVLRGTATGAESSTPIGTVAASACAAACTYTDNAVVGGTTYFYQITASNSGGTSAPSPESMFSVPFFPPNAPAKPTITGH